MGLLDTSGGSLEEMFAPGPPEDRIAREKALNHNDSDDEKVADSPVLV